MFQGISRSCLPILSRRDTLQVVLEYCEFGSLESHLRKNIMTEQSKILVAGDCAEGLAFIVCVMKSVPYKSCIC